MYPFADITWNPLAGTCEHRCIYCSTKSFYYPALKEKYSGKLRLVETAFKKRWNNKFIFVVAQNEGFKWILSELSAEYCGIANKRIFNNGGLFLNHDNSVIPNLND